jgi:hypothetical protein
MTSPRLARESGEAVGGIGGQLRTETHIGSAPNAAYENQGTSVGSLMVPS